MEQSPPIELGSSGNSVILGTVISTENNRVIMDAIVIVCHKITGEETMVVTDGSGQFRIGNLAPGPYLIKVSAEYHKPFTREDLALRIGSSIRVNMQLLALPRPEPEPFIYDDDDDED